MTEAEWLASDTPDAPLRFLEANGRERAFHLFSIACCRLMIEDMKVHQSVERALDVLELHADGRATREELTAAVANASFEPRGLYWPQACREALQLGRPSGAAWYVSRGAALGTPELLFRHVSAIGVYPAKERVRTATLATHAELLRDIFGNPFRPIAFAPEWRTDTVRALAREMYESRDFGAMPILADALQDAGCDNDDILNHCRNPKGVHVRGCWVVDSVLEKE
ncbi:hypothetical protein R5W23_002173 [Gemmata sp. JC673]|uniref:SMI1/KNR4 family protein n=1 Tax=Gemmata algarum TaxID=2975278 RepID=A0ABU5F4Z3_9BACT|nr:hypothetical protein [Gemmata algarum]MDY3560924.1 hypothetical protein [Gemmata algarum]